MCCEPQRLIPFVSLTISFVLWLLKYRRICWCCKSGKNEQQQQRHFCLLDWPKPSQSNYIFLLRTVSRKLNGIQDRPQGFHWRRDFSFLIKRYWLLCFALHTLFVMWVACQRPTFIRFHKNDVNHEIFHWQTAPNEQLVIELDLLFHELNEPSWTERFTKNIFLFLFQLTRFCKCSSIVTVDVERLLCRINPEIEF